MTLVSALILRAVICRREKSDGQATLAPTAVACTERPDSLLTQTFAPVCGSPASSVDGYPQSVLTGWTYSPSYGGVKMNEIEDLTPWPLLCCFGIGEPYDLPDGIEVTMAGNPDGCPDHATVSHE
ncbi:hypothetical protein, partial [Nocardia acidivorans]|uniref:hypothetical protein n=1 Tax=Nocardia acidivorans TaxID=404580 RepID=UPI000A6224BC